MSMLFIKLPVRDLPTARAFYDALGFRIEEHSSDEETASVVVDDDIALVLHTRDRFAGLVSGDVGDPSNATTAVHCLTAGSRDEVDDLVAKAVDAGGRPGVPVREEEARYTGGFTDPDGHAWEVVWMDQLHVVD